MSVEPTPGVLVVGSVNVDLILRVARLPDRGETVIGGTFTTAVGGKGANQAAAAARLGARVWLVGAVGDDEHGANARPELEAVGVDLTFLETAAASTGVATVLVDDAGDNLIAVASGANTTLGADHVTKAMQQTASGRGVGAVLANLEIPDAAVLAAADAATTWGVPFVLNPAPSRALAGDLLRQCTVLTPNEVEAARLGSVEGLLDAGVGAVIVTRGAAGCVLHRAGRQPMVQPAFAVDVVDTTGAGDAFSGALAWALASGLVLEEGVRVAAAAGALATTRLGARAGLADQAALEGLLARQ